MKIAFIGVPIGLGADRKGLRVHQTFFGVMVS